MRSLPCCAALLACLLAFSSGMAAQTKFGYPPMPPYWGAGYACNPQAPLKDRIIYSELVDNGNGTSPQRGIPNAPGSQIGAMPGMKVAFLGCGFAAGFKTGGFITFYDSLGNVAATAPVIYVNDYRIDFIVPAGLGALQLPPKPPAAVWAKLRKLPKASAPSAHSAPTSDDSGSARPSPSANSH